MVAFYILSLFSSLFASHCLKFHLCRKRGLFLHFFLVILGNGPG